MRHSPKQIADLLGSRLCHDLISPIGAVCNGVELLGMGPAGSQPEVALISDSIENANYKIQFYRIAYGLASEDQMVSASEIKRVLSGLYRGSRLKIDWSIDHGLPRIEVKQAFLLIQCIEDALPYGGELRITHDGTNWLMVAEGRTKFSDQGYWQDLCDGRDPAELTPAKLHYAMANWTATESGRALCCQDGEDRIALQF